MRCDVSGDSAYSIAWMALGNRTAADEQFRRAFDHMDLAHFNVWKGALEFHHGSRRIFAKLFVWVHRCVTHGFLFVWWVSDIFFFSFLGLRLLSTALRSSPTPLLPPGVVRLQVRVSYQGSTLDIGYDSQRVCVSCVDARSGPSPLVLVDSAGVRRPLGTSDTCIGLPQSFDIMKS